MPLTLYIRGPTQYPITTFNLTEMLIRLRDGTEIRMQVQDQHVEVTLKNLPSNETMEQLLRRFGEEREPDVLYIDLGTIDAGAFCMQWLSSFVTENIGQIFNRMTPPHDPGTTTETG
ncbi:hypothetical protein JTE90_023697 [Oedothorax gibbosus]|uniref:STAS domain-containing protein n=1 Tax=Oedothorax gibbosus TaxID=931172 RepID=A0AAV6TN56_9ARAC|nr:hypothetical protein JTE90_023697 [Oedothorax gibbosus]